MSDQASETDDDFDDAREAIPLTHPRQLAIASPARSDLTIPDLLEVVSENAVIAGMEQRTQQQQQLRDLPQEPQTHCFTKLPDSLFYKLYTFLDIEDMKICRLVCQLFNDTVLSSHALVKRSHFIFDGRHDDADGNKCQFYFDSIQLTAVAHQGCGLWTEMCLRRAYSRQLNWISSQLTSTITALVIHNCSINWRNVLLILTEFENLVSFTDMLDMYFWDYATFAEGIKDGEAIVDNPNFLELLSSNENLVENLENLRHVKIHRCQLANCMLYLKILLLKCTRLESIEVTSDQRASPRPFVEFYSYLGQLIQANAETLTTLKFPYKTQYPSSEFHVIDDNNSFDVFLNYVTAHNWATEIQPLNLTNLTIQFPTVRIDEANFQDKLLPFLGAWTSGSRKGFKNFAFSSVYLEAGQEHVLVDSIPSLIESKDFGVWILDTEGLPFIEDIVQYIKYINIQLSTPVSTELKHILMLDDVDDEETLGESVTNPTYSHVKELQFFNKAVNFKSFNLDLIVQHFPNLTHLNLIDFNIRVDRIHSSESPATIEDEELQKMFQCLTQLEFLQLTGNMTYLTDAGLTGISPAVCKRMFKRDVYEIGGKDDVIGYSFSSLRKLRTLVLRGVGIKVTDVTAYFAFNGLPYLKKLQVYGSHQITPTGKARLMHMFPASRNCSLQI